MEIPLELKKLYSHWLKHTDVSTRAKPSSNLDQKILKDIEKFSIQRQKIWEKKTLGKKKPYTKDMVLSKYKFCNVYRELDRQTIEIHIMLKGLEEDFDKWLLNVLFCRLVCNAETIKKVGLLSFRDSNNRGVYQKLLKLPRPKYGSAYIFPISLIMKSDYPTREEFFCFYLPQVTRKCSKLIKSFQEKSVVSSLEEILPAFGFNLRFHWTEVLIDTAYQFPELIDLFKRFPIGPGAKPTMKLLSNEADPENTCLALTNTPLREFPHLTFNGKKVHLSVENWEGIACEYRKYSNLKKGTGRRRLYK